jgi:hypothetical protein
MAHSYGFGGHELSSSSLIQSSQVNHAYTSGDTSESQSKDQLTPFTHFTNKFLVSPKPEANLATGLNDPWSEQTMETVYLTSTDYHGIPSHYGCSNRTYRIYQ